MLSSWTRLSKSRAPNEQHSSPFSTPHTALLSSSIAARQSSVEGYRPPAVGFDHDIPPGTDSKVDEDQDGVDGQEQEWEGENAPDEDPDEDLDPDMDGDMDEDGDEEVTPLLPIFSAAHLGTPPS